MSTERAERQEAMDCPRCGHNGVLFNELASFQICAECGTALKQPPTKPKGGGAVRRGEKALTAAQIAEWWTANHPRGLPSGYVLEALAAAVEAQRAHRDGFMSEGRAEMIKASEIRKAIGTKFRKLVADRRRWHEALGRGEASAAAERLGKLLEMIDRTEGLWTAPHARARAKYSREQSGWELTACHLKWRIDDIWAEAELGAASAGAGTVMANFLAYVTNCVERRGDITAKKIARAFSKEKRRRAARNGGPNDTGPTELAGAAVRLDSTCSADAAALVRPVRPTKRRTMPRKMEL